MNTIKFVGRDKRQFTAILRKNVNDYFKQNGISSKGNGRMIFKSLIIIILFYVLPFLFVLTLPVEGWMVLPFWIVMGVGIGGIGMGVMHDAAHGSFSNKKWINNLFSYTMYIIGGNTFNWKIQHNILHHTYTNIEGYDEDIDPKGFLRLSKQTPFRKFHRFQHLYAFFIYSFMSLSRMVTEFKQLRNYNKRGLTTSQGSSPEGEMTKLIVSKIIYIMVIIGLPLFLGSSFWPVITGFFIMHLIAGLFMSTVFQMAHVVEVATQPVPDESGVIENEWAVHELETTANFVPKSRWFGWIIGGLNYQVEHHLFPNICHIHYKAISPIVERTAKEFGISYNENKTFFSAIASHIRVLKSLGKSEVQMA